MSCPICDNKHANCDCSSDAIRLHEENATLRAQVEKEHDVAGQLQDGLSKQYAEFAKEMDAKDEELRRLNLQLSEAKSAFEALSKDMLFCQKSRDATEKERDVADRLNGEMRTALELIRDNTGKDDGEYAIHIATQTVGPLVADRPVCAWTSPSFKPCTLEAGHNGNHKSENGSWPNDIVHNTEKRVVSAQKCESYWDGNQCEGDQGHEGKHRFMGWTWVVSPPMLCNPCSEHDRAKDPGCLCPCHKHEGGGKVLIKFNGKDIHVANSLSYDDIVELAGEREGASVVVKPADRKLAGFSLIKGQFVDVTEGMIIGCIMTGNA